MSIGKNIARLRRARALTQEELCRLAGLGHNAVSRVECDDSAVTPRTLKAICDALGVDPTDVVDDIEACFFVKVDPLAYIPKRAHSDDAGFDLFSPKYDLIPAHNATIIDTGVHVKIPKGFAGLIVSKSGLNMKYGVTSDGLIDAGYTGSIKVKLYNHTNRSYEIRPMDKISQIVFIPIVEPVLMEVDDLGETERGEDGFGSTGR